MPAPTPIVTPIPTFAELPAGGNVPLSGADSIVSPGATYTWQLVETPEGSTAQLQNSTTATPTLTNVDVRGTYIVFLKITDTGGSSHPAPYPIQATTAPYGFNVPLATAFGVVRVAESPSGLVKPGRGEYGWFEQGLWPLVDKVNDGLDFPYYDNATRTLTANAIVPDASTGAVAVNVNGLNVAEMPASIALSTDGVPIVIAAATTVLGVDLTVSGGILRADEIRDASGGGIIIAPNADLSVTATQVELEATTGPVSLQGQWVAIDGASTVEIVSGGSSIKMPPSGDIVLTAADDLSLDAADNIVLTAVDNITLTTSSFNGDIRLATSGDDGDIELVTEGPAATITLATSGSNGDIILVTTGSDGDISLTAGDDLLLATTGADSDISLTAPGAGSSISLTAANGVSVTSTGASADVTVTSAQHLTLTAASTASLVGGTAAVTGTNAVNLTTDDGNLVISIGGDAVNETVDRATQITFNADNRRRIIDLDGFVSQRNHIATKGGETYPITVLPGNAPALVPFRDNVTMSYRNEALEGPSSLPDFTLSFHASFHVTGFTTIGGNNLTFSFVAYDSSDPSERVTLATFNFTPGGSLEVTGRPCVIQGMVHSVGGKSVYCSGTASLQISDTTNVTTLSAALANATDVFFNDGIVVFAFLVNSVDTNVTVTNTTGVCSLIRGS